MAYPHQRPSPNSPWAAATPVQALAERACDPSLPEPAYTLNLELADYVNTKKANSPRDAAVEVLKLVNHRNPHVSVLALHLLDTLVKNCGYPFQLQVGTKEFLNELVRKFPERPPAFPGVSMSKTLELIHEWKNTICVNSKWKEDLVHIRDMHRLLSYKGYRFRDFDRGGSALSSNGTDNLKSPQELEEEDRSAKSAKLQELIRRGSPKDLLAAQELMKALSGAEPDKAPDYRSQTEKELDKVQQKAILLNDMLNNAADGERIGVEGDAYQQVALFCKQARPKIQKWIGDVPEDEPDSMDRLLLINDLINGVVERFEACRKGDWSKGRQVDPSFTPQPPSAPEPSLISFDAFADDDEQLSSHPAPNPSNPTQTANNHNNNNDLFSSLQQQQQPEQTTSSGLPLDLFSSSFSSPPTQSSSSSFSAPPKALGDLSSLYAQPYRNPYGQQQQQQQAGSSTPPSNGGGISLGGAGVWGASASLSASGAGVSPSVGGSGSGSGQQQQQQQTKKDPFEGLLF